MKAKTKLQPKLNVQRDYITLKLPTGNFTTSYGGSKVSGQLVSMDGAFEALDNYVIEASKTKTYGEAMNDLLDTKLLDKLVPNWDKPIIAEIFEPKDKVKFVEPFILKKYPNIYEVKQTKGKYTYIFVPKKDGQLECIGFASTQLTKII